MGGKGRRRLGPEERRLWDRVAATASPLRQRPAPPRTAPASEPAPGSLDWVDEPSYPVHSVPFPRAEARPPHGAAPGWTFIQFESSEPAPVGRSQPGLDRRTADRLRKGTRAPDARIDLHGMTADRAHRVCLRFLGEAIGHGHRVVLVITGKGRGGGGVLRESLPGWLRASPLGQSVVGIYQAHRKHGGEGAFYVYLKRRR
jgi:DNA-nicking Smr family endonuclease